MARDIYSYRRYYLKLMTLRALVILLYTDRFLLLEDLQKIKAAENIEEELFPKELEDNKILKIYEFKGLISDNKNNNSNNSEDNNDNEDNDNSKNNDNSENNDDSEDNNGGDDINDIISKVRVKSSRFNEDGKEIDSDAKFAESFLPSVPFIDSNETRPRGVVKRKTDLLIRVSRRKQRESERRVLRQHRDRARHKAMR
jgi:hypothetical protein